MNNSRLQNLKTVFDNYVRDNNAVGASVAVFKDCGEKYFYGTGYADKARGIKMERDTIFRCFSMSKPVTAVALLILVERGIVDLYDPVSKYIPEFEVENMCCEDNGTIRKCNTPMTVFHLFNMTSGVMYPDETCEAGRQMLTKFNEIMENHTRGIKSGTVEIAKMIASMPLSHEPGTHWRYGTGADVIGAVIEVASGMRFGEFLKKEIFEPLGMEDTGFYVPEDKLYRFAEAYEKDEATGELKILEGNHLAMEGFLEPPHFESGGAGLVSTVNDYSKFAMMLANGGQFGGTRILSEYMVDFMGTNQLTEEQRKDLIWDTMKGYGYGNLCRVVIDTSKTGCLAQVGSFGWDGWLGNYFIVDPIDNMVLMYVIQKANGTDDSLMRKLINIAYSAI